MTGTVKPRDKLDASANGPEDDVMDWAEINWPRVDDDVRRLRQRIFTATRDGDLKRVRNLQKLMLRSRANGVWPSTSPRPALLGSMWVLIFWGSIFAATRTGNC